VLKFKKVEAKHQVRSYKIEKGRFAIVSDDGSAMFFEKKR
tara:strand:- start:10127 stop:10246 length:120 start_codon:yes stop_codon:yes gene_type:complete